MNEGLLESLEANDPDFIDLTLTSECESKLELLRFLEALQQNTTVENVIFRESFFPFRKIRNHLESADFGSMLRAVGEKVTKRLTLAIPLTITQP